jgi:hypothetical protein
LQTQNRKTPLLEISIRLVEITVEPPVEDAKLLKLQLASSGVEHVFDITVGVDDEQASQSMTTRSPLVKVRMRASRVCDSESRSAGVSVRGRQRGGSRTSQPRRRSVAQACRQKTV